MRFERKLAIGKGQLLSPIAYGSLQVPWLFRFADRERQGFPFCGYVIGGPRMGWHGLAISRVSGLPLNLPVYMFSDKIKK
ncbi:hypothetical protein AA19596_2505 [Acetobacter fabarum DSM 19596]|nr:hypothetical protein AA19596_2505 [Acetobacter fabarum DSM 19596]